MREGGSEGGGSVGERMGEVERGEGGRKGIEWSEGRDHREAEKEGEGEGGGGRERGRGRERERDRGRDRGREGGREWIGD